MWPFQKQPRSLQRQIAGPPPAPGLQTPRAGQLARQNVSAPFSQFDPLPGPGRASERINQEASTQELNGYLAAKVPAEVSILPKFAHRIRAPKTRYYPRSPWKPSPYAVYAASMPDANRPLLAASAPIAFQRTAGGLIISDYQTELSVVNSNLASLYSGASAPVSANQSGACK